VSDFRIVLFSLGMLASAAWGFAQEEGAAADVAPADDMTTADVVLKGHIPDWQTSRLVHEGFEAAEKARIQKEQKAADKKTVAPSTKSTTEKKSAVVDKATKLANEPAKLGDNSVAADALRKAAEAKAAADRANGITAGRAKPANTATSLASIPPKAAAPAKPAATAAPKAAAVAKAQPTAAPSVAKSQATPVPLDNVTESNTTAKAETKAKEPAVAEKPAEPEKKSVVANVQVAPGKSMSVKTTRPVDDEDEFVEPGAAATRQNGDQFTVEGSVISARPGSDGKMRLSIKSASEGTVQVVVNPRVGTRVPLPGARVTVSGKKIGGTAGSLVVQADTIRRSDGSVMASSASASSSRYFGATRVPSRVRVVEPFAPGPILVEPPFMGRPMVGPGPMMMAPPPPMW